MIYKETMLSVIDNCGARKAKCIGFISSRGVGFLGSFLNVVLRKFFNLKKKIKKKIIYIAVVVGTKF
jgi:ribosomal protein L14